MEHFHLLPSTWRGEESFVVIAFLFSLEQLVRTSMNLKKMNCKVTHSFEQRNGCCSMLTPNLNHRGEEEIFNDKRLISGLFEQRGRELRFDMKWEGRCFSFFSPSLFVVFSNIFCENGRTNKVFRIAKTISKFSNRIFVNQWLTIKNWFLFYSDDQIWTKTKRESRERERERRKSLFKLRIGMRPLAHSCSMLDAEEKTNDRGQGGGGGMRKLTWKKMNHLDSMSHVGEEFSADDEPMNKNENNSSIVYFPSMSRVKRRRREIFVMVSFNFPLKVRFRSTSSFARTRKIWWGTIIASCSIFNTGSTQRTSSRRENDKSNSFVQCFFVFFDHFIFGIVTISDETTLTHRRQLSRLGILRCEDLPIRSSIDFERENLRCQWRKFAFRNQFDGICIDLSGWSVCNSQWDALFGIEDDTIERQQIEIQGEMFSFDWNWSFCSLNCWSDWANLSLSDLISSENIDTDRKFFVARLSPSTVCQRSFIVECALLLVVFDILILRRILLRSSLCLSRWISSSISPSNTLIQSIRIARLSPKLWLNLRRRVFSIVDTIDFVSFQREHLIFSVTIHNSTERPKMSIIPPVSIFMSKRPNWSLLPVRNLSHRTAKICSNILPPIHSLITVFNYFPSSRFLLIFKLVFVFGLVDFQSNKREFLQRTTNVVHRWWLFSHPHLLTLATSRSFETIWQTGIISLTNSFFIQSFSLQRKNIDLRKRKFSFKSIDWGKHQGSIAADEIQSNAANPDIEEDWIMILNEHSKIHIRQIIKNKTFYESNIKPSMIAILLMLLFQPRIPAETSSTTMSCSIANKQTSRGSIPSKKSPLGGWSINWKRRSWTAKMNDE